MLKVNKKPEGKHVSTIQYILYIYFPQRTNDKQKFKNEDNRKYLNVKCKENESKKTGEENLKTYNH